jgi:hypothetical protein
MESNNSDNQRKDIESRIDSDFLNIAYDTHNGEILSLMWVVIWRRNKYFGAMEVNYLEFFVSGVWNLYVHCYLHLESLIPTKCAVPAAVCLHHLPVAWVNFESFAIWTNEAAVVQGYSQRNWIAFQQYRFLRNNQFLF